MQNPTASLFAKPTPLNINLGSDRFSMFNKERDIPRCSVAAHPRWEKLWGGRRRCGTFIVHTKMEVAPWYKSTISAEA